MAPLLRELELRSPISSKEKEEEGGVVVLCVAARELLGYYNAACQAYHHIHIDAFMSWVHF